MDGAELPALDTSPVRGEEGVKLFLLVCHYPLISSKGLQISR